METSEGQPVIPVGLDLVHQQFRQRFLGNCGVGKGAISLSPK